MHFLFKNTQFFISYSLNCNLNTHLGNLAKNPEHILNITYFERGRCLANLIKSFCLIFQISTNALAPRVKTEELVLISTITTRVNVLLGSWGSIAKKPIPVDWCIDSQKAF